jgi:hypothetical protein
MTTPVGSGSPPQRQGEQDHYVVVLSPTLDQEPTGYLRERRIKSWGGPGPVRLNCSEWYPR